MPVALTLPVLKQEAIEDLALTPTIPPPIAADLLIVTAPLFEQALSTDSFIVPAIPPTSPPLLDSEEEKLTAHLLWQLMIFPFSACPTILPSG